MLGIIDTPQCFSFSWLRTIMMNRVVRRRIFLSGIKGVGKSSARFLWVKIDLASIPGLHGFLHGPWIQVHGGVGGEGERG